MDEVPSASMDTFPNPSSFRPVSSAVAAISVSYVLGAPVEPPPVPSSTSCDSVFLWVLFSYVQRLVRSCGVCPSVYPHGDALKSCAAIGFSNERSVVMDEYKPIPVEPLPSVALASSSADS